MSRRTRRDGATIKQERLKEMHKILSNPGALPMDLDHCIAFFEFRLGLSNRKVLEYLEILEKLDFIEIDYTTKQVLGSSKLPTHEQKDQVSVRV